ncbi:MAG: hypothetical protein WCG29_13440 [Desulfomonile sp.]|jgi:hypothetical protein
MKFGRMVMIFCAGFFLSLFLPPIYALDEKKLDKPELDGTQNQLVGVWEIAQTKEPGKPYRDGYKGLPFVTRGANAFTLILEYRKDGTFRRTSRIGEKETVQDGRWKLSGHELRHLRTGAKDEEVIYLRFDNPDQYTSLEVFEATPDPGLFAQFRRHK